MSFQEFVNLYFESAAYHEAGHAVVAAVQRMPLRHGGIHIDPRGQGITFYWYRLPDGSRDAGPEPERERTIISTSAGLIAQQIFFPGCPDDGAKQDTDLIVQLLDEMYSRSDELLAAKEELWNSSRDLIELHWSAVEGLAQALWQKPLTPRLAEKRNWSEETEERFMSGDEVVQVLQRFGISAFIQDDSVGQYAPPPQYLSLVKTFTNPHATFGRHIWRDEFCST